MGRARPGDRVGFAAGVYPRPQRGPADLAGDGYTATLIAHPAADSTLTVNPTVLFPASPYGIVTTV